MSISPELVHIISLMVAQTEMAQAGRDVAAKATPAVQPPTTSVRAIPKAGAGRVMRRTKSHS